MIFPPYYDPSSTWLHFDSVPTSTAPDILLETPKRKFTAPSTTTDVLFSPFKRPDLTYLHATFIGHHSHDKLAAGDARFDYDICELEMLGQLAIDLKVQNHPVIKYLFSIAFDLAGQKGFCEECAAISQLLLFLQNQVQYRMAFIDWYMGPQITCNAAETVPALTLSATNEGTASFSKSLEQLHMDSLRKLKNPSLSGKKMIYSSSMKKRSTSTTSASVENRIADRLYTSDKNALKVPLKKLDLAELSSNSKSHFEPSSPENSSCFQRVPHSQSSMFSHDEFPHN
jgi:hypothetical protein